MSLMDLFDICRWRVEVGSIQCDCIAGTPYLRRAKVERKGRRVSARGGRTFFQPHGSFALVMPIRRPALILPASLKCPHP